MHGLDPEFQLIETNGIRLHCAMQGSQNKHRGTIVFLHGFPEFWYGWRYQIAELSKDYRVVAPDLRGFNLSDKPVGVERYHVKEIVADIAGLIVALGDQPVTLVGHDWGGAIAWPVAAYHPHLISRLIILNGPHPSTYTREIIFNPQQRLAAQYIHSLRRQGAAEYLAEDNYQRLLKMTGTTGQDADLYIQAWSQPGSLDAQLNYYRAMPYPPPLPDEEVQNAKIPNLMVQTPTLVVWGERDEAILPGNLISLDHYVPNLQIHRIPNATHWVQHDAPLEVNSAIRAFLTDTHQP